MDGSSTTLTAWTYGAACVGFTALGVWLGLKRPSGKNSLVLLLAVACSAAWGLLGWRFASSPSTALLVAVGVADVLRIGFWYAFLILLIVASRGPGAFRQLRGLAVIATILVAVGLVAQAFGTPGLTGGVRKVGLFDSLAMAVFALVLVETLFRNLPADARWDIKPLCIGLVGVFGFDIYLYADAMLFNRMNIDAFSIRGLVHAALVPLVAITAARSGNWTSRVVLSRRLVFHSAALTASGVYLLFVSAAGYYVRIFGGQWGRALEIALVFAGVLTLGVLAMSGATRAKIRVLVSKHLYRYRYDYREEWLRFTQTLSACEGQAALGHQIVRGLADLVESPSGALWLRHASGRSYTQSARWNMPAESAGEPAQGALSRFVSSSGWVIDLNEYRTRPERYGELDLPAWLGNLPSAWLVVPLNTAEDLIGFVVLGQPRTRMELNWEVSDVLKTAGRQAASFLGHMQAADALLEARKFDAFNRMSAFVVHDLKNIVSQLSLMLKNAERHKDNAEFQQDMLMTVGHSVDRMKQMMMQLRDGTTPVEAATPVDIAQVVRRIQGVKQTQQPRPQFLLEEHVFTRGHADRIERVIGHVVQNAIDATAGAGEVRVALLREGAHAVVEVRDNGCGMPPEFARERLFKPFQTTKQGGMGIGAYESYQYVHELGGDILVESEVGRGTTMRILLPLCEAGSIPAAANRAVA